MLGLVEMPHSEVEYGIFAKHNICFDGCASAMEIKCLSDGNKVPQRWKSFAIAEAQLPERCSCSVQASLLLHSGKDAACCKP